MYNRNSEELFALVKRMNKYEKKHFHLYSKRNGGQDLRLLRLYRALNGMVAYDEDYLKKKMGRQLPNLKVSLYQSILDSLRLIETKGSVDVRLHQLMDHANILYGKAMIVPALKSLQKVKAMAMEYHQVTFIFQALVMEKKIELVYGNYEEEKINRLNGELAACSEQLVAIGQLSNTHSVLYGWHQQYGFARNEEDRKLLRSLMKDTSLVKTNSFYTKLYFLQAQTIYSFSTKQEDLFFEAAKAWVDLFRVNPQMKEVESLQYERGLAYLSEASLMKKNIIAAAIAMHSLTEAIDPFYFHLARLNLCLLQTEFDSHLMEEVLACLKKLKQHERLLLLSQKSASLCMLHEKYDRALDFINKALQVKTGLSTDLQYHLRLMQIEAHKRLGNYDLVEYLELSTKRFTQKSLSCTRIHEPNNHA